MDEINIVVPWKVYNNRAVRDGLFSRVHNAMVKYYIEMTESFENFIVAKAGAFLLKIDAGTTEFLERNNLTSARER